MTTSVPNNMQGAGGGGCGEHVHGKALCAPHSTCSAKGQTVRTGRAGHACLAAAASPLGAARGTRTQGRHAAQMTKASTALNSNARQRPPGISPQAPARPWRGETTWLGTYRSPHGLSPRETQKIGKEKKTGSRRHPFHRKGQLELEGTVSLSEEKEPIDSGALQPDSTRESGPSDTSPQGTVLPQ